MLHVLVLICGPPAVRTVQYTMEQGTVHARSHSGPQRCTGKLLPGG